MECVGVRGGNLRLFESLPISGLGRGKGAQLKILPPGIQTMRENRVFQHAGDRAFGSDFP